MASADVSDLSSLLSHASVDDESILSFAGRGLKLDTEQDAKEVVDCINACKHMVALRLEGNTLGVDASRALSKALEKHPELQRALWSDMFTGRLKSEIPLVLRFLSSGIITAGAKLTELDLSDNAFGPTGIEGVVELLKHPCCFTLKELRLNNNGLGPTGGQILAKTLVECHKLSTADGNPIQLRVFVSGRGRLENEGSTALAEVFKLMGSLEKVSMPQNGINAQGIAALADAFAVNKKLRQLELNDNIFTEVGAAAMAKALPEMQNLELINFEDCILRSGGAIAIANSLREGHQKLKEVNLGSNEIKKNAAIVVVKCIENKAAMETFNLNGNELGKEGIETVKETLEAINRLDLLGSMSDDEGSSDDDDDDDDDGDEDEENENEADQEENSDDEGVEVDDPELQVRGKSVTPSPQSDGKSVMAAEFLLLPTESKLLQMGPDRPQMFLQELGDNCKYVEDTVGLYMKISSVVSQENEKAFLAACECADVLLKSLCEGGEGETTPMELANSLLVHIGLLKSEDKKFRPVRNVTGPMLVLNHVVKQEYFPKQTRDVLLVFVVQPHKALEHCTQARMKVMETLYQF